MKKHKTLLCLLAALAVLAAAYAGLGIWNDHQEEKAAKEEAAEEVTVTDIEDITGISYQYDGEDFSFAKKDDTWYYTKDEEFPVAQSYIDTMAGMFGSVKAERELKNGDALSDYGLEQPAYTITLQSADGSQDVLYFGNTVDDSYYLTLNDKENIYMVSASLIDTIAYQLDDLLQKETLPSIGSSNLKRVTITKQGQSQTYDSEEEEQKETITEIGGGFGAASFGDCVSYSASAEDMKKYGLDEGARTTVEAVYTDSDDKEQTLILYVGAVDESGSYYYVNLDGSKMVYQMGKAVVDNILSE